MYGEWIERVIFNSESNGLFLAGMPLSICNASWKRRRMATFVPGWQMKNNQFLQFTVRILGNWMLNC